MNDEFLKPRSAYEAATEDRASISQRELKVLLDELSHHKVTLDDHGYQVESSDNLVAVKRGGLDVVRIVFNYGGSGTHRVTNGIAEALRQDLYVDLTDPAVARHEFKVQLRRATDLFYANKSRFEALGLA